MNIRSLPAIAGLALALVPSAIAASGTPVFAAGSAQVADQASPAPAAKPAPAPAPAEDFFKRFTITLAPIYDFSTGSDDNAPPLPGYTLLGKTTDQPTVGGFRLDYGASFAIDKKTSLSFSHGNVGYQLGRISLPAAVGPGGTGIITGSIWDYTDTIALGYGLGHGVGVHVTYFDHQRSAVTGLVNGANGPCLNQKTCNNAVTGVKFNNPNSIDEHGYTAGATYDFGPTSRIGPILSAAFDAKFVPRPGTPNNIPAAPGTIPTALGDLGSYRGSQVLFPYSLTLKVPIANSSTFIPFLNYTNLPVLYRDSAVPEEYRGIIFGFVKVINKNANLSYTNLNLQSCHCVTRLPGAENLRLSLGIIKLDLHTQL